MNAITPAIRSSRHEEALRSVGDNIPVIPCEPGTKIPAIKNWQTAPLTTAEEVNAKWAEADYNLAIEPERAGWAVVDLDGADAEAEWNRLCTENGTPIKTTTVRTPRGGVHLYFTGSLPATVSKLGPHIDTRGRGSYVLVPPSVINGVEYQWSDECPTAPLPSWVNEQLAQRAERITTPAVAEFDLPANIARAEARLRDLVARGDIALEGQGGDDRTYRLACEIRDLGLSPETTFDLLYNRWNPHCRPPWPADELCLKIENAFSYGQNAAGAFAVATAAEAFGPALAKLEAQTPDQSGSKPEIDISIAGSEDDLASQFAAAHGSDLRFVAEWNKWLSWNGHCWTEVQTCAVWNVIRPLARAYVQYVASGESGKSLARKILSKPVIANVEALARGAPGILARADIWDADPWLLNTPGGIVDLKTGKLHEADARAYCIKSTAVAPAEMACPLWHKFLSDVTAADFELQKFLQRIVGYSLTGTTREHGMFFPYGTGGNGKGVFISTNAGILASYAKTAPVDMFTETKNDRHPTDIAMLRGARFVAAEETDEGRAWAEAKLKALTGGGAISARFMHQDFFEFTPQFKLFVVGNHKPRLRNVDEAMRRRLHVIPFGVIIPKEARDPDLSEKLKAEWPGILHWAIQGCLEWQRIGLAPPAAVTGATEEYFAEQDPLAGWLEERCVRTLSGWAATANLYSDYSTHLHSRDEMPEPQKRFHQRLESAGFKPQKNSDGTKRGFAGITLRGPEDEF